MPRDIRGRCTRRLAHWPVTLAVGIVILCCPGCGGCRKSGAGPYAPWGGMSKEEWLRQREERLRKEREEEARAKAQEEAAKRKQQEEALRRKKEKEAQEAAAAQRNPNSFNMLQLPERFEQWTEAHYAYARARAPDRLAAAIRFRIQQHVDDPSEAEFLSRLLDPSVAEKAGNPGEGAAGALTTNRVVLEAAIEALAQNGTPRSAQLLEQILAGTLPGAQDSMAVEAALRAMGKHRSAQHLEILLRAVAEPAKVRTPGRGGLSPEELQQKALAVLRTVPDSTLRARLAERFVSEAASPEFRRLVEPVLSETHPANLEAHAVLYTSPMLPPQRSAAFERELASASSTALARLFGLAIGDSDPIEMLLTAAPAGGSSALHPHQPVLLARRLWCDTFVDAIQVRHAAIRTAKEAMPLVVLSATVPREAVRRRLERTLRRYWDEGPAGLEAEGLPSRLVCEPGFLTVLRKVRLAREPSESPKAPRPARLSKGGAKSEPLDPAQKVASAWLALEERLVRQYCQLLHAAATRQPPRKGQASSSEPSQAESPFLGSYPEAILTAAWRWDRTACAELRTHGAPLDPLELAYVRLEATTRPDKVMAHYRRHLGKTGNTDVVADGWWLWGLQNPKAGSAVDSVDILITRTSQRNKRPDLPQELTIEILVIGLGPAQEESP